LSGFLGTDSYCIISPLDKYIITDFRYAEQAKKQALGFEIVSGQTSFFKKTIRVIKEKKFKRVGFESQNLTVKETQIINKGLSRDLVSTFGMVEELRILKDKSEITAIEKAASIASAVLKKSVKALKKGSTEMEIAAKIDFAFRKSGAQGSAFETIVASGPNGSMPHAHPTKRRVRESEPVIIDCGVRVDGYNSDLTRTCIVGTISRNFKLIYSVIKSAQSKAICKIKPGVKISDIDKAARDYITKKGFGKCFGHATGHCIGIDVHELPSINSRNHKRLREGMVFTIEPGIYIPEWGGVRIEDMVVVTNRGHRVLTRG